jgi:putative ABC transport system permease protein
VRKAPARSALIAALVAIPVLAGTFALVTISTARLSAGQAAARYLGSADAIANVTQYTRLFPAASAIGRGQSYSGEPVSSEGSAEGKQSPGSVDLASWLPAGATLTPSADNSKGVSITAGRRTSQVTARPVDLSDPVGSGLFSVITGSAPSPSGEVAVTGSLAHRLKLSVGSHADVSGLGAVTVTAIIRDPRSLSAEEVIAPLAAFGGMPAFQRQAYGEPTWLITFPGHQAPDLHAALAARGVVYETRQQWEHPSRLLQSAGTLINAQVIAVLSSVIGFGIAEIVLLAGTAFAVGTRRQVRELGLLRATGGDERDVRRVVLAQGVVLGLLGAAAGVVAGVVAVFLARPLLEHVVDTAFGPLDGRPLAIAAVCAVGVLAGVLAAVIPARSSARLPVLDMLSTRFPTDAAVVRNPRWAWAALVAGPLVVIGSAVAWHHSLDNNATTAMSVSVGQVAHSFTAVSHDGRWTALVSLGAALTLAGLARSCPALLTRIGRLAHRLPLSLRLATRDAARHRHRTAPAAAAVATVVAGAVLVLFVASSTDVRNRRSYLPYTPVGTALISGQTDTELAAHVAAARSLFAVTDVGSVGQIGPPPHAGQFGAIYARVALCQDNGDTSCDGGTVQVADATAVDILAGRHVALAGQTLASGGAVVIQRGYADHGRVGIDLVTGNSRPHVVTTRLAALTVPDVPLSAGSGQVLVSAATAAAHHWPVIGREALLRTAHLPSKAEEDTLRHALGNTGFVMVERGYHGGLGLILLALVGAAALATLAGTSIAVALAMAESRADMATLAAVGASPSRRRVHAMAQAAAVGALGSVLGLALGCLVGVSLLQGSTSYPFTVPLRWLALLVLAAPVLAIVVAGSVTRGRVDLTRRIA